MVCAILRDTNAISDDERIGPAPTCMGAKKNPGRAKSAKMRMISALRVINLSTNDRTIYAIMVPTARTSRQG